MQSMNILVTHHILLHRVQQFFSACAYTEGNAETKRAAFSSVLDALLELKDNRRLRYDSYTWPAIWKACENLLDIQRDLTWINRIFELCIRSGSMSERVFNNIRNFLPPKYLQKKLQTTRNVNELTAHDLPAQWTSSVKLGRNQNKGKDVVVESQEQ